MTTRPSMLRLATAFAAVYVLWGGTYLAIRFAIETIPPHLMGGSRFLIAGTLLYGWTRVRGAPPPTATNWKAAGIIGALLLLGGNGAVVWAEQYVSSGTTAMLIAVAPLWLVLIDWLRPGGRLPNPIVWVGLGLGLVGLFILVGVGTSGHGAVHPIGATALILASLSWALGSIYSRHAPLPASVLLGTAMEMLAGGALLLLLAAATGQLAQINLAAISLRSVVSYVYLIVGGSLLGFTAYIWLLHNTTPARAGTYAYVNPVVAVFLGWAFAGEPITPRVLVASAIIAVAVAVVTAAPPARTDTPREPTFDAGVAPESNQT